MAVVLPAPLGPIMQNRLSYEAHALYIQYGWANWNVTWRTRKFGSEDKGPGKKS